MSTISTLRRTNMSHLGKRNIIFKSALGWDMLVPRGLLIHSFASFCWWCFLAAGVDVSRRPDEKNSNQKRNPGLVIRWMIPRSSRGREKQRNLDVTSHITSKAQKDLDLSGMCLYAARKGLSETFPLSTWVCASSRCTFTHQITSPFWKTDFTLLQN